MTNTTFRTNQTYSEQELEKRQKFDRSRPLERDESKALISSEKVEGTPVFATDGEKVGTIDHVMLGKYSGRVEYAVMSFGGFLGMGESFHPLPWDALDYDEKTGGYVVNIDKERLRDAPYYTSSNIPIFDRTFGQAVYGYYGIVY